MFNSGKNQHTSKCDFPRKIGIAAKESLGGYEVKSYKDALAICVDPQKKEVIEQADEINEQVSKEILN